MVLTPNTVFGETLKVPFDIDARVAQRNDLVTLRTGGPKAPAEVLGIVRQILSAYGIEVVQADTERNLLLVKGSVPGPNGGVVIVRNAVKGKK